MIDVRKKYYWQRIASTNTVSIRVITFFKECDHIEQYTKIRNQKKMCYFKISYDDKQSDEKYSLGVWAV